MQQILVIEDEADVRSMLRLMLIEHGFSVLTASDALTGLRLAYQHRPDAIILDVMMPGMDGFEACRRLREMTDTPILLLTGQRTSTEDIVKGLALGADEYMTKPFKMSELMGRLRVCLRRSSARADIGSQYLFPAPGVVLDCGRHELTVQGRVVSLSPSEFEVFQVLVRHAGHILSHNAILAQAWGPERIGDGDLIKQYIYQLRQKIEPDPTEPRYIHTVRGEGYYFEGTEP